MICIEHSLAPPSKPSLPICHCWDCMAHTLNLLLCCCCCFYCCSHWNRVHPHVHQAAADSGPVPLGDSPGQQPLMWATWINRMVGLGRGHGHVSSLWMRIVQHATCRYPIIVRPASHYWQILSAKFLTEPCCEYPPAEWRLSGCSKCRGVRRGIS